MLTGSLVRGPVHSNHDAMKPSHLPGLAIVCILSLLAIALTETPSPPPPSVTVSSLATNRFTNILTTLRVEGIDTPCPECGRANHHECRLESVEVFEVVTAIIVAGGQTNVVAVYQSPKVREVVTNIVPRLTRRGWTTNSVPPPLP